MPTTRTGRLSGRWLTALLVTGLMALLMPGASHAALRQASPAATTADVGCRGVTPAVIPALGFITNPGRSQGGHLWWRAEADGICIGTVVEWVQYNTTATKTWRVIVYTAQHPGGQVVAQQTFTVGRGWSWWSLGVHEVLPGMSAVCVTADESFGMPCLHFGPSQQADPYGRRRSVALAALAMITANGGIARATAETMTAAVTE